MRLTNGDIESMVEELRASGHLAPDEKAALCLHPFDKGTVTVPAGAEVYLSRSVPTGYAYVLTPAQAKEHCPPYVEPTETKGAG